MASAKPQSDFRTHDAAATVNGAAPGRRLHLKPSDAGREVTLEDFEHATGQEGWRYELIDGRIEVSPAPDAPHDCVMEWLDERLRSYRDAHPESINKISTHARVYIAGRRAATCPEPDLAAYRNYPLHTPIRVRNWRDVSPILVVETVSEGNRKKDLIRNVSLIWKFRLFGNTGFSTLVTTLIIQPCASPPAGPSMAAAHRRTLWRDLYQRSCRALVCLSTLTPETSGEEFSYASLPQFLRPRPVGGNRLRRAGRRQRLKAQGKDVIELQIGDSPFPGTRRASPPASRPFRTARRIIARRPACSPSAKPSPTITVVNSASPSARKTSWSAPGAKVFEQFFCEAFLDPGDAVLLFTPHFPDLRPQHRTPRRRRRVQPAAQRNQFRPDLNDVERLRQRTTRSARRSSSTRRTTRPAAWPRRRTCRAWPNWCAAATWRSSAMSPIATWSGKAGTRRRWPSRVSSNRPWRRTPSANRTA